ncbi:MAG: glycosyltransferase family 2 protein [Lachnospiraceae bacterium]|nr:glycosyltransferase family 2 protein [Lachnospiraceae bacterium]
MSEVTVIIPNYNGIKYLKDCLDSLAAQTMKAEIIVVDNASEDGSEKIAEDYEGVRLIPLSQNFGFCRAVNEGIKVTKTKYLILLNNDTKADPSFVEELYKAIDAHDDTFSVASKMLQMNAPDRIDSAGDLYCALGWAFSLGKDGRSSRYDKEAVIFSACGGAAIYRKELFEQIGYFDELHFTYLEDVDVGYRARIMGYVNRYTPKAVVYHAGSGSTGGRYNPFKVRLASRNSWYVIYKNMPALQIIINLPFLLIGFGTKALFFICKGYGREYLSGMKRGYLMCVAGRKYPFDKRFIKNYFRIQLELWLNMIRRITG